MDRRAGISPVLWDPETQVGTTVWKNTLYGIAEETQGEFAFVCFRQNEQIVDEHLARILTLVDQQKREFVNQHSLHRRLRTNEIRRNLQDLGMRKRIRTEIIAIGVVGEAPGNGQPFESLDDRGDAPLAVQRCLRPGTPFSCLARKSANSIGRFARSHD